MTEQKAIEVLEYSRGYEGMNFGAPKLALDMAIKALEKQIPKKPRFYAHNYHCTECDNLVGNNEFEWQRFLYCDECGQRLDWSEV